MKLPRIIGCIGIQGAGKDSVCKILESVYYYKMRGFSDPGYESLYKLDPFIQQYQENLRGIVDRYGWETAKRSCDEIRVFLQKIGTDCGRDVFGQDCWINVMHDRRMEDGKLSTAIRDVRFENEIHYIRHNMGKIIWVKRPGVANVGDTHRSESLDRAKYADAIIENTGSLKDLEDRVIEVMEGFVKCG